MKRTHFLEIPNQIKIFNWIGTTTRYSIPSLFHSKNKSINRTGLLRHKFTRYLRNGIQIFICVIVFIIFMHFQ